MTHLNPNPEGLPSRIELPGGYWFKRVEDLDRFPKTQSRARWYYELKAPSGRTIHTFGRTDALALATAMNTHTDTLGAALEKLLDANDALEAQRVENLAKPGTYTNKECAALVLVKVKAKEQARAALEAWKGKGG